MTMESYVILNGSETVGENGQSRAQNEKEGSGTHEVWPENMPDPTSSEFERDERRSEHDEIGDEVVSEDHIWGNFKMQGGKHEVERGIRA